ncbi:unnamed protein product [Scytosiphon promiscuus]
MYAFEPVEPSSPLLSIHQRRHYVIFKRPFPSCIHRVRTRRCFYHTSLQQRRSVPEIFSVSEDFCQQPTVRISRERQDKSILQRVTCGQICEERCSGKECQKCGM